MVEGKKAPEIRFDGFVDDWVGRRLSDVYGKIRNAFVGTATPYYVDNGHFYLQSNNVKDGQINRNTEIFINDEFYEKQKDKWLRTGDLVMVQSGHVGHMAVIPKELDNTAAHALIIIANPTDPLNPYFLNYQFQIGRVQQKIDNITTGNTIKHILASEMKNFIVELPRYEEQTAISSFFRNLDDAITLKKQQYKKIVNIKKAMLEKMFPKNGADVPEIRVDGFDEPWKSKRFDEILVVNSGRDYKHLDFGDIPVYGTGGYMLSVSDKLSEVDGIGIGRKGTIDKPQYLKAPYWTVDTLFFLTVNENYDLLFLYTLAQRIEWKNYNEATGVPSLSKVVIEKITQWFPCYKEQTAIGNFFRNIDDVINLSQQEIEKLQNIKKACLKKMFV